MNNGTTQVTVPTDSPSIFAALNTMVLANGVQLAIVRPNNPPPGIAGFIFDIIDEDGVQLSSDISVYPTSANTPISDHISLAPELVMVGGTVAEVVFFTPNTKPVSDVKNPLPDLPGMGPAFTPGAEAEIALGQQADATVEAVGNAAQSLWGYYLQKSPQQPNQTKQSLAFGYIYQLWKGRQLFSVETPWGFFTNMALKEDSTSQGERSRWSSQSRLIFQKVHFADTPGIQPGTLAGRAYGQQTSITTAGNLQANPATTRQESNFIQTVRQLSP